MGILNVHVSSANTPVRRWVGWMCGERREERREPRMRHSIKTANTRP